MKNGNLFQKLKSAKKDDRVASVRYYEMKLAMERELEEATRPIKEKYGPILETLEMEAFEKGCKVWSIGGNIRGFSTFSRYNIVYIVAVFLSYIEGEKYIPFSSSKICQNSIIIKENVIKEYGDIDYNILDKLYKNGDLIMLDDGYSNMVSFYNNVGDPKFRFGKFNYLHEFVNRLTQYRIENDKKNNMTMDELYSFMCSFISTHPYLVQKNKDKREQMLMVQSEEETVISECKKLEKELKI